ncbi:MAG: alpha/beta hydrolase [Solirubrobacteraceae bacterium]
MSLQQERSISERAPTASGELRARVGEVKLCYETFGSPDASPLLLVMGLGAQMILWDDEFCEQLATHGFWVIRFDNRDVGRSTILRDAGVPKRWQLVLRDVRGAAYSLPDMASDAVGLLDHLQVRAAHVVGASMGGMIAQLIACRHPERVLSLVSIMSTTGNRRVGQPQSRLALRMLRKVPRDREGYIEDHLETYRTIGSKTFAFDEEHKRARAGRCFERGIHPSGSARQMAAIVTAPDRTPLLAGVDLPATVIHGDADPLVNVSGGRATAAAIPDAELVVIAGMGHDLPRDVWPQVIGAIVKNAARAA